MFARWGRFVVRSRWGVLAAAAALVVVGVVWGTGVFGRLTGGGFNDPDSESAMVRSQAVVAFGPREPDVLALYSSPTETVADPDFKAAVTAALDRVRARPEVTAVTSFYDTGSPDLVSADRHATYAVIVMSGPADSGTESYENVAAVLPAGGGVRTQLGGNRAFEHEANRMTTSDIERAELLSTPILLVLLVLIFGSVVAAASPLLIGGVAILGAFIVTRLISQVADVSTFAINIITLIGLGLSIDYALFVVSRFRDEMAAAGGSADRREPALGSDQQGRDRQSIVDAVSRTMATAGRTVAVSGVTVTLALASLLLFKQGFLRSMAYGGMAAVAVAMLASLTVLPAWLAVLGPRIDAWHIPLPQLRRRGRGESGPAGSGWARLARSVMRRPWLYLAGTLVVLVVLAAPVTRIQFGGIDVRVLPASSESRTVADRLDAQFPHHNRYPVEVLATGVDRDGSAPLVSRLAAVPGVTGVTQAAAKGDLALYTVDFNGGPAGDAARRVVRDVRALPEPPGVHIGVTGYSADLVDQLGDLGDRLPWMVLFVVVVTLVLLFAAFGSVVLPVKAVLMNVVSLGAAFGAVVFVFQQGHFAGWLGYTATGFIEPNDPILMVAVLFGLSTDYEVFLLSRVREEWVAGADNTTAVATGLQRTGRIITSAALLLVVVIIGFATGRTGFVKLIGVGMIVAIVVDATLVRALLVPATMRLLGRWNWWAPGPLRRLHDRPATPGRPAPAGPGTGGPGTAQKSTMIGA
jgi:RND superfamily putative drug exporter